MSDGDKQGMYLDISGEWRPENPKLAGSGITPCRPQVGTCPGYCADCFFRGGRYYEPLDVPHIPDPKWVEDKSLLVRMNDGNDSNHERELVIRTAAQYKRAFFNTRIPCLLFPGPVTLTVNGDDTDNYAHLLPVDTPGFCNLMCVRVRVNSWNLDLCRRVIDHYVPRGIPVRLTFMAYYHETVREPERYEWRKRTLNSYWVLRAEERVRIEEALGLNGKMVHACTSRTGHLCRDCLNCLRIYRDWTARRAVKGTA